MVDDLFLDLDADEDQLDFPVIYTDAKRGRASLDSTSPRRGSASAVRRSSSSTFRRRRTIPAHPLQVQVDEPRRLSLPRPARDRPRAPRHDRARAADRLVPCRWHVQAASIGEIFVTRALERVPVDSAGPGDIVAVAGLDDVTIGETIADADDPRALPVILVDEPSLSVTLGVNTSPFAGRDGDKLTARLIKRGSIARRSATSPSASSRPTGRTRGRCRVAASCSSRCSSR